MRIDNDPKWRQRVLDNVSKKHAAQVALAEANHALLVDVGCDDYDKDEPNLPTLADLSKREPGTHYFKCEAADCGKVWSLRSYQRDGMHNPAKCPDCWAQESKVRADVEGEKTDKGASATPAAVDELHAKLAKDVDAKTGGDDVSF